MNENQMGLFGQEPVHEPTREEKFLLWVESPDGRMVEKKFIELATMAKAKGLSRYGAKAIWETLRWHFAVDKGLGEDFKLNNNYTALMARRAEAITPELEGFFEKRKASSDE